MSVACVTVVVATYNRPDILPVVLRSALAQGPAVATVLVIGDQCDERIDAACASLDDPRVRYINLPARFGEQSGPNSIGMLLAETEFIAFLNHDDMMLPGHIDRALVDLDRNRADLFLGRAAWASTVRVDDTGRVLPLLTTLDPEHRKLPGALGTGIEPASAWVFRRNLVDRVGTWRAASSLYRHPIDDWMLRAWRSGIDIVFGREISVVKIQTHYLRDPNLAAYDAGGPEYAGLESWIEEVGVEAVRATVVPEATRSTVLGSVREGLQGKSKLAGMRWLTRWVAWELVLRIAPRLFRLTGFDIYSAVMRLLGRSPGERLDIVVRRRTGTSLPDPPSLDEMLRHIASLPPDPRRV